MEAVTLWLVMSVAALLKDGLYSLARVFLVPLGVIFPIHGA